MRRQPLDVAGVAAPGWTGRTNVIPGVGDPRLHRRLDKCNSCGPLVLEPAPGFGDKTLALVAIKKAVRGIA